MTNKIKIKYIHSPIGREKSQGDTIKGLGFRKLNETRELLDTPSIRGMIRKVSHLLKVID